MGTIENFRHITEQETIAFPLIIELMYHSRKKDGRKFLCTINNIIDDTFAVANSSNQSINFQIIHIPASPEWARELLVRFIVHKAALTFNRIILDKIQQSIKKCYVFSADCTKKERERIFDENKYRKKVSAAFSNITISSNCDKSLVLVKEQDIITRKENKNPWLENLYTTDLTADDFNVIVSHDKSAFDLEEEIRLLSEYIPCIENIFIFHSPNRSRITNSYNIEQLERLNRYGLGIKNCIIFSFSNQPLRLYYTIDNIKVRLVSNLLKREVRTYNDFDGFTTFSPDESNMLFNRENNETQIIIDDPEYSLFTSDIDSLFEQVPHNLKYKNALALSFSDSLQRLFFNDLSKEIGYIDISLFADFCNQLKQSWNGLISIEIETFLDESPVVAFITPRETSKNLKQAIKSLFASTQRQIKFYSIDKLKEGVVNADKIVILQYRYTDKTYKSYPNSFDALPLKQGQKALKIINMLTHREYYEWNKYWYEKDYNGLLYSTFRKRHLGWKAKNYQRPSLPDIRDYIDEAEVDNREYQVEKCTLVYKDGKRKEYMACEQMLYMQDESYIISELKEISQLTNIHIQALCELTEQVKTLISIKAENNTKSEEYLRRDIRYGLSEEQIRTPIELWKILLKRKVDEMGVDTVYNAIFPSIAEISLNGFKRWYDFSYSMILPRSRKSQKALLTYLGFELGSPYHRIVLAKKLFSINNSRILNSQIAALLQAILPSKAESLDIESLMEDHADILTLLEINDTKSIAALIDLLDIQLKTAIKIEYDPN